MEGPSTSRFVWLRRWLRSVPGRFLRWVWNGRRIALAFALTPGIVAMVLVVSLVDDERWQAYLLGGTAAAWLFVVFLVRLPEDARDDRDDLRGWLLRRRRWLIVPAGFVVVVAILSFEDLHPSVRAVQASLLLWPFSIALYQTRRFVSRAWKGISWGLAVLTAVVFVVLPIAVLAALDHWNRQVQWWVAGVLLAVVVAAFVALVTVLHAARLERAVPTPVMKYARYRPDEDELERERPRGALALISVSCALLSSLLLLGSAVRVPLERRLIETSQVAERGAVITGVTLDNPAIPTEADKQKLIEMYSPVLRLHEGEAWIAYNASAALVAGFDVQPSETCENAKDEPCSKAAFEDVLDRLPPDARPPRARVFAAGAVYPRFLPVRGRVDELGDEVPRFARTTEWLLQYWLFYPNNEWKAASAVGSLVQSHGGDWEWVGVGLDGDGAPLFVAYSAHCSGTWRPWTQAAAVAVVDRSRVLVGGDSNNLPSHPLVIVARGSHANYATTGAREPDWGSCQFGDAPFAAQALRWLTFITAAREETPDLGSFQVPTVLAEADTDRDARRALWWGKQGLTRFGPIVIAEDDHGPDSPSYQEKPWEDPIKTIFDSNWECDAGERPCQGPDETATAADQRRSP